MEDMNLKRTEIEGKDTIRCVKLTQDNEHISKICSYVKTQFPHALGQKRRLSKKEVRKHKIFRALRFIENLFVLWSALSFIDVLISVFLKSGVHFWWNLFNMVSNMM